MLERLEAATRNNAEWCDALCRTHGIVGELGPDQWASAVRTPPRYPDAITLEPNVSAEALLARIDHASPGCSVKDSFADLELSPYGFHVLFDAEWIAHEPDAPAARSTDDAPFSVISTPDQLDKWAQAWGDGGTKRTFLPSLLTLDDIAVFAWLEGNAVTAGFVANRSHRCVGISNVFATDDRADWTACTSAIGRVWPGLPIVGYETGADLDAAVGQGFVALGPLRIWAS